MSLAFSPVKHARSTISSFDFLKQRDRGLYILTPYAGFVTYKLKRPSDLTLRGGIYPVKHLFRAPLREVDVARSFCGLVFPFLMAASCHII